MKNNKGQSTIEFLVTMIFSLGIILMFVRLGLNTTSGFLAHYATYMASRTYLVMESGARQADGSDTLSERQARTVMESFTLQRYGIRSLNLAQDLTFNDPESVGSPIKYEYVGVVLKHSVPFALIPILGPPITLDLITESFLGKEPTRGDCLARICRAMSDARGGSLNCTSTNRHLTLFDNGC